MFPHNTFLKLISAVHDTRRVYRVWIRPADYPPTEHDEVARHLALPKSQLELDADELDLIAKTLRDGRPFCVRTYTARAAMAVYYQLLQNVLGNVRKGPEQAPATEKADA